jgi:hypothetical protein
VINGDGYVKINRASITAAPGARVLIRGGKSLQITGSTIGPEGATEEALSIDGMLPTETDTTAALMTAGSDATIMIDGDSMITGVFIAPDAEVRVMGDALIHGRIVAARIDLGDRCIVFAVPDDGRVVGLTSQSGPHRTADGELVPLVCHPSRLSPLIVHRIANELGVPAIALDEATAPLNADDDSGRRRWNNPRRLRNHRRWRLTRGDH